MYALFFQQQTKCMYKQDTEASILKTKYNIKKMIEYILNYNACALFNGHKHILMWSLPNFFNLS